MNPQIKFLSLLFIYLLIGTIVLKIPSIQPAIDLFCASLAQFIGMVLHVVDGAVQVKGLILFRNSYANAVEINSSCSALSFVMIMSSALLAFPSHWKQRIKALIFAFLFVQSINVLRIISLLYVQGGFSTDTFDFIHTELWPFLMILVLGAYYMLWAQTQHRQMHNSQGVYN